MGALLVVLLEPLVLVDIVAAVADTPAVVVVGIVAVVVVQADSRPVGDLQTMSCCQF